jgi:hypothetical protein
MKNLQEQISKIKSMMGLNTTIKGFHISKTPISKIDNRFLVDSHLRDKP